MARGVTTEWEDIHVRLGNFLPREKETTTAEISQQVMDKAELCNPLEDKKLEELDELEDELDEKYLEEYRLKRLEEIKSETKKLKFGDIREINKQEYIAEVTNAPKDVFVVLNLYQD